MEKEGGGLKLFPLFFSLALPCIAFLVSPRNDRKETLVLFYAVKSSPTDMITLATGYYNLGWVLGLNHLCLLLQIWRVK